MDLLQITSLLLLSLTARADYAPSASYGAPAASYDSHGDHGDHGPVKRLEGGGCPGWGSGGSGGVHSSLAAQPGVPGPQYQYLEYGTQPYVYTQPTLSSLPATQPPSHPLPTALRRPARPDYLPASSAGQGYSVSARPYNFGYAVRDFHSGADFKQQETSDGNTVRGQYRVQLPDGRTQIVTYTADWQTGFHADVQYEGEASYPAVYGTGGSYPPSAVSTSYGAPSSPSSSYGVPSSPSSSYGVPSSPSSSYGVPSHSSTSYSTPQQSSYTPSPHGYQSRVGVAGVGSQYQNLGHSQGSGHGHQGY